MVYRPELKTSAAISQLVDERTFVYRAAAASAAAAMHSANILMPATMLPHRSSAVDGESGLDS